MHEDSPRRGRDLGPAKPVPGSSGPISTGIIAGSAARTLRAMGDKALCRTTDRQPTPESDAPGIERRNWPRVPLRVEVRLRFADPEALIRCRTFDISEGGAFIQLPQPRPRGTEVRIFLRIANRVLVIAGVVARVAQGNDGNGPSGMGVQFTDMTPEDREYLHGLVAAQTKSK